MWWSVFYVLMLIVRLLRCYVLPLLIKLLFLAFTKNSPYLYLEPLRIFADEPSLPCISK